MEIGATKKRGGGAERCGFQGSWVKFDNEACPSSGIHAALEKRPVVESEMHGEADGRGGKDCDKEPALPVMPRAGRPENEGDEYGDSSDPLRDGLLVGWIHRRMNGTPSP